MNILKESDASEEAKKKGLEYKGFGRYANNNDQIVAKSEDGKLVAIKPIDNSDSNSNSLSQKKNEENIVNKLKNINPIGNESNERGLFIKFKVEGDTFGDYDKVIADVRKFINTKNIKDFMGFREGQNTIEAIFATKKEDNTKKYYHLTTKENADKILENGLEGKDAQKNWGVNSDYKNAVFLTSQPKKMMKIFRNRNNLICFEVNTKDLDIRKDPAKFDDERSSQVFFGNINKDRLKIVDLKSINFSKNKIKKENFMKIKKSELIKLIQEAIEAESGFIPGTKNKKFNIVVTFEDKSQDVFDITMKPDEYISQDSFLNSALRRYSPTKILAINKIVANQNYTETDKDLEPWFKKMDGKFTFQNKHYFGS